MTLPSSIAGRTTQQVGFFAASPSRLARWLKPELGDEWAVLTPDWSGAADAFKELLPKPVPSMYAWIPLDGHWTLLLNDTPLGTDPGLLPMRAAEHLQCRAIRATCVDDDGAAFAARVLEVYGPTGGEPFYLERSLVAANDGGRWVFETSGDPFDFEDLDAYNQRKKSARFTAAMLYSYARQLGVPVDAEPQWAAAVVVRRHGGSPESPSMSGWDPDAGKRGA